jgi:hypothetical protein
LIVYENKMITKKDSSTTFNAQNLQDKINLVHNQIVLHNEMAGVTKILEENVIFVVVCLQKTTGCLKNAVFENWKGRIVVLNREWLLKEQGMYSCFRNFFRMVFPEGAPPSPKKSLPRGSSPPKSPSPKGPSPRPLPPPAEVHPPKSHHPHKGHLPESANPPTDTRE